MLPIDIINILTGILLLAAFFYFLRRNEEIPMLIVLFLIATGIRRYNAVHFGLIDWVYVKYTIDIFELNDEKALTALTYFFMGSAVFMFSFMMFRIQGRPRYKVDNQKLFDQFLKQNKLFILGLFGFFFLLNSSTSSFISGSLAMGNSYFYLFKLAIGGIILLLFLLYKSSSMFQQPLSKLLILGLIVFSAYVSFNPYLRFQFLSWAIALGILILGPMRSRPKLKYYALGGILVVLFFSLAGVARTRTIKYLTLKERYELAMERTMETTDQNMLDGFMMVLDVYPQFLNWGYGSEHFAILLRPIPRRLWPDKPLGGYHNKLGLNDVESGTVGISQTIYGTFYGEGGVPAIVLFSLLYGWLFARLLKNAEKYDSDMRYLIKGIVVASLLPILRGGDLPGIIAFIGMGFWPAFLFIYRYKRFLRQYYYRQRILQQQKIANDTINNEN